MEIELDLITANLPEDIITEILLRLPVKSLLRFRCVSKSWLFFISSYRFAKEHLKISTKNNVYIHDRLIFGSRTLSIDLCTCSIQSIIEASNSAVQIYPAISDNFPLPFDRVQFDYPFAEPDDVIWLVGSCNGLVCVHLSPNTIFLWNPTTRKLKRLPDSGTDLDVEYYGISFAFGYDELHDDYKVVEFFGGERVAGVFETQVKVYSLRANSWKTLSNWPGGDTFGGTGKFLNGALHWSVCSFDWPAEWVIVSHDLATDTFTEVPLPKLDDDDVRVELKILKGCLALYCEHNVHLDIWVMKEYGVKESWTKFVRIPFLLDFRDHELIRPRPLFFSVDGKVLINYGASLHIYDLSNPHSHQFSTTYSVESITYFESLVSPSLDDEVIIGRTMPSEIILEILLRLPVKSLMRFKSVSKEWLSLISSSRFAKAHLKASTTKEDVKLIFGPRTNNNRDLYTCSINSVTDDASVFAVGCFYSVYDETVPFDSLCFGSPFAAPDAEVRIVGSCNGLVCLSLSSNIISLVNPATRVSILLPSSGTHDYYFDEHHSFSYSFGYDEVHDDYKVVELIGFELLPNVYWTQLKVYSLRTNSWKTMSNWPGGDAGLRPGEFLNGSLHWSVRVFNGLAKWIIISLDLATDTFGHSSLPNNLDIENAVIVEVVILGDCLSVWCKHKDADLWVMEEYGVRESWAPLFRIPLSPSDWDDGVSIPRPVFLWVDGKILMNYGTSLRIYDLRNPLSRIFDYESIVDATTYLETLVSLTLDEEEHNL
ncbi:F-box/kelch-repeat protein at3g23880 [Phtheirospermum japonicum]|uniref:F-box/kelch-repeat protein at3g23880 n=1 Tax=Phtheirospermum japonicum TaxID=374723 RepID=A0A830BV72_9LAMI|nr:F-box/kelch-repeat protein at3g23880 [Phtheirospermum japonicum]